MSFVRGTVVKSLFFLAMAFIITVFAFQGCVHKTVEKPTAALTEKAVEIQGSVKNGQEARKVEEEATDNRPSEDYTTKRILYVREKGIPEDFKGLSNPLDATAENIEKGEELYRSQCSGCHGAKGLGDVFAGRALRPPPSNIAIVAGLPEVTDSYLFWTVSEGGRAIKTTMLPFKSALSEEDIWRLILYIRTIKAE
jgi:mono/diheme cytochrome c family protein